MPTAQLTIVALNIHNSYVDIVVLAFRLQLYETPYSNIYASSFYVFYMETETDKISENRISFNFKYWNRDCK